MCYIAGMPSAKKGSMSAQEKKEGLIHAADLLKTNNHAVRTCMFASGMSDTAFYRLLRTNTALNEIWEEAKEVRGKIHRESLVIAARVGAYKLLTGHKETLTRIIRDANGEVISTIEWEVYTPPSANAVMGILRHIDRESIPEESLMTVQHEIPTINVHHQRSDQPAEAEYAYSQDNNTYQLPDGQAQER